MFRYVCIWWAVILDGRSTGTHVDHPMQHVLTKVSVNIFQINDICVLFKDMLTMSHDSIWMWKNITGSSCHQLRDNEIKYLTVAIMKIALRDMKPCSLVDMYRRFRGTCCVHYPDNNEVLSWNYHGGTVYVRKLNPNMRSPPLQTGPQLWY